MSKAIRAVVGVAAIVLGATVLWPLAGILYPLGASLVIGAILEKTPQSVQQLQQQSVMVRSAVKPQEVLYGKDRKSGVVVWFDTSGVDNEYLWFVVAVVEHQINSYKALWLDDTEINTTTGIDANGFVTHTDFVDADGNKLVKTGFYSGQDVQTADPYLVAEFDEWTTSHRGDGVAYFWVRCELDRSEGGTDPENPTANVWHKGYPRDISVTAEGALVYDPSQDDLNGGTGTHRVDTASTWEYSSNPVLCRADYLRSTRFGPGYTSSEIDWATVITESAVADQTVSLPDSGAQTRYTMNGVLSVADQPKNNLELMQTSDYGTTLFLPSGVEIRVGHWDASSHTIDESWLAGAVSAVSSVPADDAYNAVRGQYLSASDDYTLVEFAPRLSSAYETEDGVGRIWQDIVLPFTNEEYAAQRLAIIELKKSRQQTAVKMQCNFRAELIGLYQVVTLDLPGFSLDTFRVIGKASSTDGTISLDLIEEVATDWTYDIPDLATPPIIPTVSRNTQQKPQPPTNLSTSTVPTGVRLFWDLPALAGISHIEIYSSATNDRSTVVQIGKALSDTFFHELAADEVRYYWILSRGTNGLVSNWEPLSDPDDGLDGVMGTAGSEGVDGLSIIVANAYLRKGTAPTKPVTDDGAYDFDTNTLTPPSISGGSADDWFTEPPTGTLPLYVVSGTFSVLGQTGSDGSVDWTDPDLLVSDGAPGDSIHVANAFVRSPVTPTTPVTNDGDYNFGTQVLTPPSIAGGSAEDWYTTPPDGTDPLYVSSGTFSVSGTTGTDDTVVWSSPDLITHDGAGFVPDFSPGYVGGTSDFVWTLNADVAGTPNMGEIRIEGSTFMHPDGSEISTSSALQIWTKYEGTIAGRFFIMYSEESASTRFVGSHVTSNNFLSVTHDDANGWRMRDDWGIYYTMSVVATDCIIAICTKESVAAGSGIETIQVLTGGLAGLPGADGADGSVGTDARAVNLIIDDQTFEYDTNDANPSPASGTVTATALNTDGVVWYEFFLNDVSQQNTTSNTYAYTPPASYTDMPEKIEVQIREDGAANPILARDQTTISGLKAGSDAVTIILSNEAHTLPTTNLGVETYTGSGTDISAWIGTTFVPYDGTGSASPSFRVSAVGTDITVGSAFTLTAENTNDTRRYGNHVDPMTANVAFVTYTIIVKNSAGVENTFTKKQTLSKSIQGADGDSGLDGISYFMSNESSGISADSDGAVVTAGLANTGTTLEIKEGTTALTFETGVLSAGEFKVNSRTTQSPTGMTVPSLTGDGTSTATAPALTAWTDTTDTVGYIDWEIGIMRVGSTTEENFTIRQTFTISRDGATGDTGSGNCVVNGGSVGKAGTTPWAQHSFDSDDGESTRVEGGSDVDLGDWKLTGAVGDYDIYVSEYGTSGDGASFTFSGGTGALDTWQNLASTKSYRANAAAGETGVVIYEVEIRNATTLLPEASGYFSIRLTDTT